MSTTPDAAPATDAARVDPRSRGMARGVTASLAVIAAVAFAAGVPGLVWAGRLAGMAWAAWTVPIVIDLAATVLYLAALVARARREPAAWQGRIVWALMALSAAVQAAHAVTTTTATTPIQLAVAIVIGAIPPVALVVTSHAVAGMVVTPVVAPVTQRKRRATAASAPSRQRSAPAAAPAAQRPAAVADRARPAAVADREAAAARAVALVRGGASHAQAGAAVGLSKSAVQRAVQRAAATAA